MNRKSLYIALLVIAVVFVPVLAFADPVTQTAPSGTEQVQTGTEQVQTAQATQSGTGQVQTTQVGGSVVVAGDRNVVCYQCVQTYVIINSKYTPPPRGRHMNYCGGNCQQVFRYPPAYHTHRPARPRHVHRPHYHYRGCRH